MANYVRILIRRDTSTNWVANNPVLSLGEIAADMTLHRLKVGDGVSNWNSLPFLSADVVNDLITGGTNSALSAEQGKELKTLVDGKADNSVVTNLQTAISNLQKQMISGGVNVVDGYNSYSASDALSANRGRELKGLVDGKADSATVSNLQTSVTNIQQRISNIENNTEKGSIFGLGYTVDDFNAYGKPTKITFADGVTATLSWSGTRLIEINASTGEKITINYDTNGRVIGRTVTGG